MPLSPERLRASPTFLSLHNRGFRWLFISAMFGVIGFQVQAIALGWLVYVLTGSALKLGIVTAVQALTQLAVSPFAGVVADRVERRNYIMEVRAVVVVGVGAITVLIWLHLITFWELVLCAGVVGVGFGLNGPARQALLADLVPREDLLNAVSLFSGGQNVMRIVGPAVAGLLIGIIGIGGVFFLNTLLYAAVILAMVPVPRRFSTAERQKETPLSELVGGLRYIVLQHEIRDLLLFGTLPLFFAMPYTALLPIFATNVWHSGAIGFGLLSSAPGVGGVIGALIVASRGDEQHKGLIMLLGGGAYGALLTAFALSPTMLLALLVLAAVGFASVAYTALNSTLLQMLTPNEMRGRVLSFYQMSFGIGKVGVLPGSAVADVAGAPLAVAGCGLIVVALSAAFFCCSATLRKL